MTTSSTSFGALVRDLRERAGVSQRALARASGINPAIVSRFESGQRGPSGAEQVLAIVHALNLPAVDADRLLASAGLWPNSLLALGPHDQAVLGVAEVLTQAGLSETERSRFRQVLQLLVEQWRS